MRLEERVNKLEKIKVNEKVRMCKKRKMEKVRISKGRGQTGVAIGYPIVISTDASAGGYCLWWHCCTLFACGLWGLGLCVSRGWTASTPGGRAIYGVILSGLLVYGFRDLFFVC